MQPLATSSDALSAASSRSFLLPRHSDDHNDALSPTSRKRRPPPPSARVINTSNATFRRLPQLPQQPPPLQEPRRRRVGLAAELFAQSALPPAVADALLGSQTGLQRVFHTGDAFPADRYALVRAWERVRSSSSSAKPQTLHAAVALDRVDGKHVVLTCVAKALVTEWHIRHALRVALSTLARQRGLQALLRVWDADKNWVFVQEFDPAWESVLALFTVDKDADGTTHAFSEETLREVVFQVVAHVHFLHAHELSLAGELWPQDVMVRLRLLLWAYDSRPCRLFS